MDKSGKPGHYTDLDGMRGLFACLVMFMHYGMNRLVEIAFRGYIHKGYWDLSVDFFFLLSGFVLCRSLLSRRPTLPRYMDSRLRRLAPMYLFTLAIMVLLPGRTDLGVALANVAMVQSLLGITSINYPSWSIPFELFFPIVILPALPLLVRVRTGVLLAAFLAMLLLGMASTYLMVREFDLPGLRAASGLGLGALLYLLRERVAIPARAVPYLMPPVWVALVIVVILVSNAVPALIVVFYPLAILAVLGGAEQRSVFSSGPFQLLGQLSYSVYLLHIPVLVMTAELAPTLFSHNPPLKMALAALTLALSWLTYTYIERPLMARRPKAPIPVVNPV